MKGKFMTLISKSSIAVISLLCATSASSADYKVKRSLELPIQSTAVWHLIGDFCDIDDWHPNVQACALKVMDGSLVRVLTMDDGKNALLPVGCSFVSPTFYCSE